MARRGGLLTRYRKTVSGSDTGKEVVGRDQCGSGCSKTKVEGRVMVKAKGFKVCCLAARELEEAALVGA